MLRCTGLRLGKKNITALALARRGIDASKPPHYATTAFAFYGSVERRVDDPLFVETDYTTPKSFDGEEVFHFRYRR
jgi:hypothetical protein